MCVCNLDSWPPACLHLFPKGFPSRTESLCRLCCEIWAEMKVHSDRNVMMSVFWLDFRSLTWSLIGKVLHTSGSNYHRKRETDKKMCHLKVHFSFISLRLYCLTASSLSLYLTCSSCFVILSLTFILLSFMCLCSVFRCSSYSSASGLSVCIEEISFFSESVHYLFFCFRPCDSWWSYSVV